jgi:hypothetical protein
MGYLAWFKHVLILFHRLGWITPSEDNLRRWRWSWSILVMAITTDDASNGDGRNSSVSSTKGLPPPSYLEHSYARPDKLVPTSPHCIWGAHGWEHGNPISSPNSRDVIGLFPEEINTVSRAAARSLETLPIISTFSGRLTPTVSIATQRFLISSPVRCPAPGRQRDIGRYE